MRRNKWGESKWKIKVCKRWKEMERRKRIFLKKENGPKSINYFKIENFD